MGGLWQRIAAVTTAPSWAALRPLNSDDVDALVQFGNTSPW
jgi:hypothetical protein